MIRKKQKKTIAIQKISYYVRNPKIAKRQIDDTVFLIDPDNDIVFYLNPLSTGIWQLLREPSSIRDVTTIIKQAFPEMSSKKIAKDVAKLIKDMSKRNLVLNGAQNVSAKG